MKVTKIAAQVIIGLLETRKQKLNRKYDHETCAVTRQTLLAKISELETTLETINHCVRQTENKPSIEQRFLKECG